MVTRRIGATLSIAAIALVVGACDDNMHDGGYGYSSQAAYCTQFSSCGTCTPVLGCGWCYNGDGTGTCTSDPDYCTGKQFSWTWEPTGCHVVADAGTGTRDGGASDGASDAPSEASASDAPSDAPSATDAPSASDAPADVTHD